MADDTTERQRIAVLTSQHIRLHGISLFINQIMLEQQHYGRPINPSDDLPVACERIKSELDMLTALIKGPQIVKASVEPKPTVIQ